MTQPTPDQIEAATDAMRAESNLWNDIHERLNRCATHVRGLPITEYLDAAIFGPLLATYNHVAETFADRCNDGSRQTFISRACTVFESEGHDDQARR
jgi:hypothetical protein